MSFREIDTYISLSKSDDKKDRRNATNTLPNLVEDLDSSSESVDKAEGVLKVLENLENDQDARTAKNARNGSEKVRNHIERMKRTEESDSGTTRASSSVEISSALSYEVKESVRGTISYEGELKDIETSGSLVIRNLGSVDRVFDINFAFEKGSSDLEEQYHINEIQPGESWKKDYSYSWEGGESSPLNFRETIDTFPDTEESSNVLVFGRVMQTLLKYHFESNKNLDKIKMTKNLPSGFSDVTIQSSSAGTPSLTDDTIEWDLTNVKEGETGELVLTGSFDVNNLEEISTGNVEVVFDSSDQLFSSAQLNEEDDKRTGSTRSNYYVESTEREEQPDYWDSKFFYNNKSEFSIKILALKIYDDDNEYYQISEPIIIESGSEWESESWESFSGTQPTFAKDVQISIGSGVSINSEASLALEETKLVVANIEGDKKYVDADGEEITVVRSFRETEVPAYLYIKNIGAVEYDKLEILDTVPAHFLPTNEESISITYIDPDGNEEELVDPQFEFSYEPMDDNPDVEHVGKFLITKNCAPEGVFKINYSPRAVKPQPDFEYVSTTKIEATLVEQAPPLELELVDTAPKLTVIHERRKLSVGKTVLPGSSKAEYEIILHFKNRGSHDLKDVVLKDFIPDDFNRSTEEITIESDGEKNSLDLEASVTPATIQDEAGDLLEWIFEEVKKDSELVIIYTISGKDPDDVYRASRAQITVA
ncbi:MAG: hypothetical protein HeimC3_52040 [Candidatus Heimdallarchaeota archaeon LC_3]|nr:MAG: hypothetical protein HeimC3_52040 [Candidatus Heimdallarchaeota archaeon LC_3]